MPKIEGALEVYVGLGSNIRPAHHLREALRLLGAHFGRLRCSLVYESPPFGFSGDDFLNAVVGLQTGRPLEAIEDVLTAVERAQGRARRSRAGSRTLDLDLLLYGMRVDPPRRLPRADVLEYPFVLAPLAELAPALPHPVTGMPLAEAWRRMAATHPPLRRRGALAAPV